MRALISVCVLVVAVLVVAPPAVQADLPIHCLHEAVAGTWVFHLSDDKGTSSRKCTTESVAHGKKTLRVQLSDPDVAVDQHGNTGYWTMIYDEGFEVVVGGRKFFAFNKYQLKAGERGEPVNGEEETKRYESVCDRTMTGWFHRTDGTRWGCYYGVKVDAKSGKPTHLPAVSSAPPGEFDEADVSIQPASSLGGGGAAAPAVSAPVHPPREQLALPNDDDDEEEDDEEEDGEEEEGGDDGDDEYEDEAEFIAFLASAAETWTPRDYPHLYAGRTMREIGRMMGGASADKHAAHAEELRARAAAAGEEDMLAFVAKDAESSEPLPKQWDWRDVNGINFDGPVRAQGYCGSCYAMATMYMLEARIAIKTQNSKRVVLSAQDVSSCNQYSQGCDGGYPYLVGKYGEDFGIVDEKCFPYSPNAPCSDRCANYQERKWKFTDYRYVGGYYGGCSEEAMMREIHAHGPVTISFMVKPDFMYYGGGVYRHVDATQGALGLLQVDEREGEGAHGGKKKLVEPQGARDVSKPGSKPRNRWQKTTHSVCVVGWGESEEEGAYWIVKNTWGEEWGEGGYFKLARGGNGGATDLAADTMAVAIDPIV